MSNEKESKAARSRETSKGSREEPARGVHVKTGARAGAPSATYFDNPWDYNTW